METKRYKLGEFWTECRKKGMIPPIEIMEKESELLLQGKEYIDIPISIIEEMQQQKLLDDKRNLEEHDISSHRLAGIRLEKCDTIAAIKEYEECINLGESSGFDLFHSYAHAYSRIITLLHKIKDYDKEIKYIKDYLSHEISEKEREKYTNRLNKK